MKKRNFINKNIALIIAIAVTVGQIPVSALADDGKVNVVENYEATETIFKVHLEAAVKEANKVTQAELDKLTPVVAKEFKAALTEAESLLANEAATQAELDKSFDRLSKVIHMLSFEKGDKTELVNLVGKINGLNPEDYTTESWNNMLPFLAAANTVVADENALKVDVDEAYNNLKSSFDALEKKDPVVEVDKSKLQATVNEVGTLNKDDYTEESWGRVETALEAGNQVLANKYATQKEVNDATQELREAIDALEEKGDQGVEIDKSKLQDLVNDCSKLNEKDYTVSTWKNFKKALEAAKKVLADKDATQEEVDKAYKDLDNARKQLKKVSKPNSSGNNGKLPQTGGTSAVAIGLLGGLLTTIGAGISRKKK